ncbi:hypothetical protein HNP46_006100 [Pseudomonas nitritireducens]|uniref:ART-PolyVal-like domain-containing protein n=1 Tax=Pseudomonas nitroreducens TaxID=46680 RepID=A0A7W7KRE6_PSENT|nr:hypothetical protein [Pseudomonas nitritireducens]MBB4867189.1 hypothetical protein [Pseudomonas nitritireducens]
MARPKISYEQLLALQPTDYGRSKACHADGRPLLLFHGTARDNEAWRPYRFEKELYGCYFTPHLTGAAELALGDVYEDEDEPFVLACFVRMENPIILDGMRSQDVFPGDVEHWKSLGYDGAVGVKDGCIGEYIAFDPEQIEDVARGNILDNGEIQWELMRAPELAPAPCRKAEETELSL